MVRTFSLHGKAPGSIPGASSPLAPLAQWTARRTSNAEVMGSSPIRGVLFFLHPKLQGQVEVPIAI